MDSMRKRKNPQNSRNSYRLTDVQKGNQCGWLVKDLMKHAADGRVRNQPVDPLKLDSMYQRLKRSGFYDTNQFALHVRRTFSNAMQYNPPDSYVHRLAQELNAMFNSQWRSLEEAWAPENPPSSKRAKPSEICERRTSGQGSAKSNIIERCSATIPIPKTSDSIRMNRQTQRGNVMQAPLSKTISRPNEAGPSGSSSSLSEGKKGNASEQISSDRERRVAFLMSRFAGTIARAEQQTLFSHVNCKDSLNTRPGRNI